MMEKSRANIIFSVILLILIINSVYAITASIGNARMILRAEVGDVIERSILVKNVNSVPVNITLTVTGDLEKEIKLAETSFILEAGKEKNAQFSVDVTKKGTFESKINVGFMPIGGKNGAGLSSTIIIIASGEGEMQDGENDGNTMGITGGAISLDSIKNIVGDNTKLLLFNLAVTIALLIALIIILKKIKKRRQNKSRNRGRK
ncbi:MAG: hypothetical protein KKA64_00690 [Nanoarchaeota archaeon]|nr:hypothetical protein [Nanoarchaeota archaeon]